MFGTLFSPIFSSSSSTEFNCFNWQAKPNGFADHYPYYINSYFIGKINPTAFSDKPTWLSNTKCFHLRSSHGAANQFRAMAIWTASPANAEAKFSCDVQSEVPKNLRNLRKHVKKIEKVTSFSEIMVIIHHICFCLSMFERVCPYAIWLYDQNSSWKPIFGQEKGISYQLLPT